jgi:hypothetical protein
VTTERTLPERIVCCVKNNGITIEGVVLKAVLGIDLKNSYISVLES